MVARYPDEGVELARLLIDQGANIEATDKGGWTALHVAAHNLNLELARFLVHKGAKTNAAIPSNGSTALHLVADCRKVVAERHLGDLLHVRDIVQALLEGGADINARDADGKVPLHRAVKSSWSKAGDSVREGWNPAVCKLLAEKGADIDARDDMGKTPLHIAVEEPRLPDLLKVLIDAGASLETKDRNGYTPLCAAIVQEKSYWYVTQLLQGGAEIGDIKDRSSAFWTSVNYMEGYLEWAEELLQHPPIQECDTWGSGWQNVVVNHWIISRFAIGLQVSENEGLEFSCHFMRDRHIRRSTDEPLSWANHFKWMKCVLEKAIDGTMAEWSAYEYSNKITQEEWDQRIPSNWRGTPLPEGLRETAPEASEKSREGESNSETPVVVLDADTKTE